MPIEIKIIDGEIPSLKAGSWFTYCYTSVLDTVT